MGTLGVIMAELKVLGVRVVNTGGPDVVFLDVDLPLGTWPFRGKASVKMEVAAG